MTEKSRQGMTDSEFRNLTEEVREQIEMVEVIGQRVALDRHNKALHPFHQEKTPTFYHQSQ